MFLTVAEVAERLGVSRDTVKRMVKDGELSAVKGAASNSWFRISEESFAAWVAAHTVQPTTDVAS